MADTNKYETPKTGINRWNFSGKVAKKNFKYATNGNLFGSVMIKIPAKNEKFSTTLWLKVFNSKDGEKKLADEVNDNVAEGTNWSFYGYVSVNKFENPETKKTEYRNDYIVTRALPAAEDEAAMVSAVTPVAEDSVPF